MIVGKPTFQNKYTYPIHTFFLVTFWLFFHEFLIFIRLRYQMEKFNLTCPISNEIFVCTTNEYILIYTE